MWSYCSGGSCCRLSGRLGRNNNEFAACRTNTFSANANANDDGDASAQHAPDLAQAIKRRCTDIHQLWPEPSRAAAQALFHATHAVCSCVCVCVWECGGVWQLICWLFRLSQPLKNAVTCAAAATNPPLPRSPWRSSSRCSIETNAPGVRM